MANNPSKMLDELLHKTARSFYLTVHALPQSIRHTMSVAYLLARATDTVADEGNCSAQDRLVALDTMIDLINSGAGAQRLKKLDSFFSAFPPRFR